MLNKTYKGGKKVGRPLRVDMVMLQRLLDEGIPRTEIARRLNVARSTVHAAVQRLEQESMSTEEIVDGAVLTIDIRRITRELEYTNSTIQDLLRHLHMCQRGAVETGMKEADITSLLIKCASECRQWSRSFSEILSRLTEFDQYQHFKKQVVEILIQEVTYEQRKKILKKISDIG